MRFYVPKGCTLFKRSSDGRWEARMMIDGKQKYVGCSKKKGEAYKKLMIAYNEKKKKPLVVKENELTLFAWLDQWHEVFRKPKERMELSRNTLLSDKYTINKIKTVFKDINIKDLTSDYIQKTLYSMDQGRTCQNCYSVLKLALNKARDRTGGINVMNLVEKPRHERIKGRALTKDEVVTVLNAARNDTERNILKFYIYTGCRVNELVSTLVEYVNLTNQSRTVTNLKHKGKSVPDIILDPNEIFIYGTKTKDSIRTLPIIPPLKPVLEKLVIDRDEKKNYSEYIQPQ